MNCHDVTHSLTSSEYLHVRTAEEKGKGAGTDSGSITSRGVPTASLADTISYS